MGRRLAFFTLAATLCLARGAVAAGVPIQDASKDQLKAAQRTFEAADGLFDAKRYEQAITAYRASYEIVASPNSRLQIARALTALGRLDEAHAELVGAVNDAKAAAAADSKYAPTLKAAEAELASLDAKVGRVKVTLSASLSDAKVTIGKRSFAAQDLNEAVVVAPGQIVIVATLPDGRTTKQEVAVAAGATENVALDIEKTPDTAPVSKPDTAPVRQSHPPVADQGSHGSLRPIAYVAGGVGVAGLVTFAVFGLMNKSKFDSLNSNCQNGHCGPDRQSDIDAGRRYQTIADIGLGVGVVGLGVGTTLFFLSNDKHGSETSRGVRVHVAPGYAALSGRF